MSERKERIGRLVEEGHRLLATRTHSRNGLPESVDVGLFSQWQASSLGVLTSFLDPGNSYFKHFIRVARSNHVEDVQSGMGVLQALANDAVLMGAAKVDGGSISSIAAFDLVVVCALRTPELVKVLHTGTEKWTEFRPQRSDPHTYHTTNFTSSQGSTIRVIAAAPNQMGMSASAVLATKMILQFQPKVVAMVGIAAGARRSSQGFGDILAAEHTFDYGSGKTIERNGVIEFSPDPKPLPINTSVLSRLRDYESSRRFLDLIRNSWQASPPNTALQMHVGPLGSGASVVDSMPAVDAVRSHWRKLVGIEMEAYGVHRACQDTVVSAPIFICLKSVCDFADNKNDAWQDYAAFTAANFFHLFMCAEWDGLI